MLDEIEELDLVLEHYAVTWGVKIPNENGKASWKAWGLKRPELSSTADDSD
jgi:[phosphatase 2A protein]-leucine-carboxy methyltransferase